MDDTWVLVADASQARIFATDEAIERLDLVETLENEAGRAHERDLVSDDRGRTQAFPGGAHSAMEPAGHRAEEIRRFVKRIATRLDEARQQGGYGRLILVAPPQLLGAIREELSRPVHDLVHNTLSKDYGHAADRELPALLLHALQQTPLSKAS